MAANGFLLSLPASFAAAGERRSPAVTMTTAGDGGTPSGRRPTALETRVSLVAAISSQTISLSRRGKSRLSFLILRDLMKLQKCCIDHRIGASCGGDSDGGSQIRYSFKKVWRSS